MSFALDQVHYYEAVFSGLYNLNFMNANEFGEKITNKFVNTLYLRLHIRSIDSHTIVVCCMTIACPWMCE